jgi:hypothetical protein
MYRPPGFTHLAATLLLTLGVANNSWAQEGVYVEGTIFGDIRQFGTAGVIQEGDDGDLSLDSTGIGGSVRVGTSLDRRWSLEAGFEMGNRTTVEFENPYILAIYPPGLRPRDFSSSASFISVTTMLGFHQRANRRWRFGYRAGFSFVRATLRSQLPVFIPQSPVFSIDPSFSSARLRQLIATTGLPPTGSAVTSFVERQNAGAFALGFETAISVRRHLSVVPELRALVFSLSGRGETFLVRPGVGVRWTF